jgi:hypothetical protein
MEEHDGGFGGTGAVRELVLMQQERRRRREEEEVRRHMLGHHATFQAAAAMGQHQQQQSAEYAGSGAGFYESKAGGSSEPEPGGSEGRPRGSSGSKRTRAAEVHNLSEKVLPDRAVLGSALLLSPIFISGAMLTFACLVDPWLGPQRRRSRINEKMKALQSLIPPSLVPLRAASQLPRLFERATGRRK